MTETATVTVHSEIAPFHRRWIGWRSFFWWMNPTRWVVTIERPSITSHDYFLTQADAWKWRGEWIARNEARVAT